MGFSDRVAGFLGAVAALPARAIEWHEEPAVLRGPTIEVAAYAQLVIRGRHVGPPECEFLGIDRNLSMRAGRSVGRRRR